MGKDVLNRICDEKFIKGRNVIYQGEKRVGENCYFEKANHLCCYMQCFI